MRFATDPATSELGTDERVVTTGRDILLVDDNSANLVAIEAALSPLGRSLVVARSGIEALARLYEQDFALILLDVQMPGVDGFETARLVRARTRNRATPIIFVTSASHEDDVLRGYELGAFDVLVKPIRPEVLRAKASTFVQLQERTLELATTAEDRRAQEREREHERELATQRRHLEAELLEYQMRQLSESNRRKDEFLAILAHELRNPLQPLLSSLELLEQQPDEPVSPRIRGIIMRQVDHLTRLVDDLLDVARFTSGKLELRIQRIALDQLVDEAVVASRSLLESRRHVVTVRGEGPAPVLDADPVRVVQILCNLLNNAAKYTAPGGAIELRWGSRPETLERPARAFVRVTDNGRGIPRELLPRVFDMFVQERAGSDGAGGLGLGLGLVKRLVELHGGRVRAESDGHARGASFEIELPLTNGDHVGEVASPAPPPSNGMSTEKLRTVVVDDAPDVRELVADLLRLHGHQVTAVEDGVSAVATIVAERPDVALIDIGLPEMDGYEVARRLRAALGTHPIRLVAMTGYGQDRDRDAALAAGFDAHLVKPATVADLLRVIRAEPS